MIRKLINAQVQDPGRGSFMVHPLPVKKSGQSAVYRSANHIKKGRDGQTVGATPHPEAYDFTLKTHG